MHVRRTALALAGIFALAACADQPTQPSSTAPSLARTAATTSSYTGRYVVTFNGGVPADFASSVARLGGKVVWASNGAGLAAVSGLNGAAAAKLGASRGIAQVLPDFASGFGEPGIEASNVQSAVRVASPDDPTTAFFYARQWNMRAVHADAAWAAGFLGQPSTSIFILDTGIDPTRLDLIGRVDASRSVDMLGTFLVDGVPFTEADTVAKYFPGAPVWTDLFFHGTHVASTASSNAFVTAGVTSKTTLVAVKVCAYLDICPFSAILNGLIYAAEHGADVVNLSVGGDLLKAGSKGAVGVLNRVFNFARSRGVTIAVAAGNEAQDMDHNRDIYNVFCSTPSVICVSATGPTNFSINGPFENVDAPAFFTNFGTSGVNIAAPGGNRSFVWAACSSTTLLDQLAACRQNPNVQFIVGAIGTSMATPHVAGAAALLVPILGRNPGQIKTRLQQTADDLGKPGADPFYGKGELNVGRAVGAI